MSKVTVVTSEKPYKRWLLQLLTLRNLLIVSALIVLAGGAGTFWYLMSHRPKHNVQTVLDTASSASDKGDYNAALDQLQGVVNQTSNNAQKVQVYSQLAANAASQGNLGDAIHYYELKHQLDPSTAKEDAQVLGMLYERSGDKQNAIAQYKMALDYLKSQPNNMSAQVEISSVQASLDALEGKQ